MWPRARTSLACSLGQVRHICCDNSAHVLHRVVCRLWEERTLLRAVASMGCGPGAKLPLPCLHPTAAAASAVASDCTWSRNSATSRREPITTDVVKPSLCEIFTAVSVLFASLTRSLAELTHSPACLSRSPHHTTATYSAACCGCPHQKRRKY
jgi:hypothetical protein